MREGFLHHFHRVQQGMIRDVLINSSRETVQLACFLIWMETNNFSQGFYKNGKKGERHSFFSFGVYVCVHVGGGGG